MITAITPTGDRPLAFTLCRQWMKHQTRRPDQWIVVDDGKVRLMPTSEMQYIRREPRPDDPKYTLNLNMKSALPLIAGDKILIIEDDEYYAPEYIEEMSRQLDAHEVVGIMRAKYYHVFSGGYMQVGNTAHASLAETGFRNSFLRELKELLVTTSYPYTYLDTQIWSHAGHRGYLFVDLDRPLYLGIKGLPGRGGIGGGHDPGLYGNTKDMPDKAILKQWVPKDYQVYLDILSGKLTSENYQSYFPD